MHNFPSLLCTKIWFWKFHNICDFFHQEINSVSAKNCGALVHFMYNNDLLLRNYNTSCKYLMNIFQLNIIFIQNILKKIFFILIPSKSHACYLSVSYHCLYMYFWVYAIFMLHPWLVALFDIKLLCISLIRWTKVTKCVFHQWKTGSVTSITQFLDCTKHMEFWNSAIFIRPYIILF